METEDAGPASGSASRLEPQQGEWGRGQDGEPGPMKAGGASSAADKAACVRRPQSTRPGIARAAHVKPTRARDRQAEVLDRTDRVCVVGAGSSGLTAAKNLDEHGLGVDILERESELGGLWNYGKPGSMVYRSTHMISSKAFTQYPDFPMPAELPDYPHHRHVLAYLRAYAERFGLDHRIEHGAAVEEIVPVADGQAWDVTLDSGERRRYGAIVVATGHHRTARQPSYPGEFTGTAIHAADYRTPEILAGQRVLVVGGGNSGCDIAVEAAQNAAATFHSTRRGYHYIPKYVLGKPSDQVGDLMLKLRLPLTVRRLIASTVIRFTVGSHEDIGLPEPDHRLWETHPIVNSLLPYFVRHGDIRPKPDLRRFEGENVRFVDDSVETIDRIVYATGYETRFPFLGESVLEWQHDGPQLYLNVFHPRYDTLFFAGLIQPDSGQFGLVHWQTRAIAAFLAATRAGSPAADRLRRRKSQPRQEGRGRIRYRESPRHALEVEHWRYRKRLQKLVGALPAAN